MPGGTVWSKSCVAIFLALPAAVAITGVLALFSPGSLQVRTLPVLMMFVPIWVATICVVFVFQSGTRAAFWLGVVCVAGFGLIHMARLLHSVHTWVGLTAGFALFIAFYAGSITVFTHELQEWDDVSSWSAPDDPPDTAQPLIGAALTLHPGMRESFGVQLPGEHGPHTVLYWFENQPGKARQDHEFRWRDGHLVEGASPSQLAAFLYRLHYTAGLPQSRGIYVLGLICILYGVALATGVVVYAPGFLRDLFALRVGGNLKRLWQDAHNVIGVVSLPFHVIFAWSGAILCLGVLLLAPFQVLVFNGKLLKIIGPDIDIVEPAAAANASEPMLPIKAIAWALVRPPIRAANELLISCAVLTLAIPIANAWTTGMNSWRSVSEGRWILFSVDAVSVLFAWMFWRMSIAVRYRAAHGDRNSVWTTAALKALTAS